MENAVQRVVGAVDVARRDVERVVGRCARTRRGTIDERARVVPIVVVDLVAPDRILLRLLERYEQMRLVAFAERESGRERRFVVIAVALIVGAAREVRPETFEVGIQDEIDGARHGVGAVSGRCAARDGLDRPDDVRGEQIDIGTAEYRRLHDAASIEQLQRALAVQSPQVQRPGAVRNEERARLLRRAREVELGQLSETLDEIRRRDDAELVFRHDGDGVRHVDAAGAQPTARDEDFIELRPHLPAHESPPVRSRRR